MRITVRAAWSNSTGTEVSECTADGNNTGSFQYIQNLQTCQGDIYHKASNRHSVTGSPAPTLRQRKNSKNQKKKKKTACQRQTADVHHFVHQPGRAVSMRLTGRAGLNCEASASAKQGRNLKPHRCNTRPSHAV